MYRLWLYFTICSDEYVLVGVYMTFNGSVVFMDSVCNKQLSKEYHCVIMKS